jgi:hypothetical protein
MMDLDDSFRRLPPHPPVAHVSERSRGQYRRYLFDAEKR